MKKSYDMKDVKIKYEPLGGKISEPKYSTVVQMTHEFVCRCDWFPHMIYFMSPHIR